MSGAEAGSQSAVERRGPGQSCGKCLRRVLDVAVPHDSTFGAVDRAEHDGGWASCCAVESARSRVATLVK